VGTPLGIITTIIYLDPAERLENHPGPRACLLLKRAWRVNCPVYAAHTYHVRRKPPNVCNSVNHAGEPFGALSLGSRTIPKRGDQVSENHAQGKQYEA